MATAIMMLVMLWVFSAAVAVGATVLFCYEPIVIKDMGETFEVYQGFKL